MLLMMSIYTIKLNIKHLHVANNAHIYNCDDCETFAVEVVLPEVMDKPADKAKELECELCKIIISEINKIIKDNRSEVPPAAVMLHTLPAKISHSNGTRVRDIVALWIM